MNNRSVPVELRDAPLGHATTYPETYDASLLFPVSRGPQREALGISQVLPFTGADLWTAYELTWLDPLGMPKIAIATLVVPAGSPSIVESKSMKLYLGSFAQSRFTDADAVARRVAADLSAAAGGEVCVRLSVPGSFDAGSIQALRGEDLDDLRVECDRYEVDPLLLRTEPGHDAATLTTELFRSVCPVTGQPDIASVEISYRGPRIERAGLLRYLVSYRQHPGFHEHCVERIFIDVAARCRTEQLTVYARFTRRGGLDINPFRTDCGAALPLNLPTARQ